MESLGALSQSAAASQVILNREQAAAIFPATVFYKGKSAPIQGRNSSGVRFGADSLMLVALVDTSGYASNVQESYQGYLLTEVSLDIGGKTLQPGAYGFGFLVENRAVIMDIGGNELLHATTVRDVRLAHPTPLQILPDPLESGRYRLYLGRQYLTFAMLANPS